MNIFRSEISSGEQQAKFVQDRVSIVEKHLGELCFTLGSYTKNAARLRDKTDEVAIAVMQYAEAETVNHTLHLGLKGFSSCLSEIGDHRDAHIRRLETHVVGAFTPVGTECKEVREEVKGAFTARDRELGRRKQLEKLRLRNPRNRQKILLAETELSRASADVSRTLRSLEERMDSFEMQKIATTAGALRDFIRAELALHAREVELLTTAYAELAKIDENQDLESFRSSLRDPVLALPEENISRGDVKSSLRSSLAGLFSNSNASLARTSFRGKDSPATSSVVSLSPVSSVSASASLWQNPSAKMGEVDYEESGSSDESGSSSGEEDEVEELPRPLSQHKANILK